jgi:hypothetical protein
VPGSRLPAIEDVRDDATGTHVVPIAHIVLERHVPSYVSQWESFVRAVVDGGPASVSGADGRAPFVLGLAAGRSLDERRPVAVSLAPDHHDRPGPAVAAGGGQ